MGPPSQSRKPDILRDLKSSNSCGLDGLGIDWSCGPQLASVMAVIRCESIGNLTWELSVALSWLEKVIPKVRVPFKYLMTCLAARMWPLVALVVYLARKLVTGAISGRVEMASQLREPTRVCSVLFC